MERTLNPEHEKTRKLQKSKSMEFLKAKLLSRKSSTKSQVQPVLQVRILWKRSFFDSLRFHLQEKLTQKSWEIFAKRQFLNDRIDQNTNFAKLLFSRIEVLQNCSAYLCFSFSFERKCERLERITFSQNPNLQQQQKQQHNHGPLDPRLFQHIHGAPSSPRQQM